MTDQNNDLEILLSLNGEIYFMDNGYWTKIEARRASKSEQIPHGIRYSLTLHLPDNQRILGYDNAHGVKKPRKGYRARRTAWDHKHLKERVEYYDFKNPAQLLIDFWENVEKLMLSEGEK